jgi:type III pantothenate kinase
VLGYISLVEGLVARLKAAMDDDPIQVIATGGLASLISSHSPVIDLIAPELTLDGLRLIWELNQGGK